MGRVVAAITRLSFLSRRRAYSSTVAVERLPQAAVAPARKDDSADSGEHSREEVSWMRDPKTGYWLPENHFDDVDVAELRQKLLSKKSP